MVVLLRMMRSKEHKLKDIEIAIVEDRRPSNVLVTEAKIHPTF